MSRICGAIIGIGAGYVAAIGIAAFVSAQDVQSLSLFLALTSCAVGAIVGVVAGPVLARRRMH